MAIERFACLKEIKYNNRIHKHLPENSEKSVIVFIKSLAQAKSHFAPAPHICAYLRSSRQGAFCGHSASPNATLATPAAPLHENLFIENIFVIAAEQFKNREPPRAILLRKQRRREVSAYVMPTAPVGLRRMRELRNCHIKGNFVTETALFIGAVETNTRSAAGAPAGCLSNSRLFLSSVREKKCE